jgi:hypothetical protein
VTSPICADDDRRIVRPVDDLWLARTTVNCKYPRRARGSRRCRSHRLTVPVSAVGGHLKNTAALSMGRRILTHWRPGHARHGGTLPRDQ